MWAICLSFMFWSGARLVLVVRWFVSFSHLQASWKKQYVSLILEYRINRNPPDPHWPPFSFLVGLFFPSGPFSFNWCCHARSLLLTYQQFDIHTQLLRSGVERGAYLPQLAQSAKAMQQRARGCIDHELHHSLRCIMSSILYPFAPHYARTQFGCHAVPPPRASKLTLPSCSIDLGSSLRLSSVPQSKPENRNSQWLALQYSGLSKVSPTNNCLISNTQSQTPIRQRHNVYMAIYGVTMWGAFCCLRSFFFSFLSTDRIFALHCLLRSKTFINGPHLSRRETAAPNRLMAWPLLKNWQWDQTFFQLTELTYGSQCSIHLALH